MQIKLRGVAIALLASVAGCVSVGTNATFLGLQTPVLLGPKDRVGGEPLPAARVKPFEAESFWKYSQGRSSSQTGNLVTTTSWSLEQRSHEYAMSAKAEEATGSDSKLDIRLTMVKPQAYGIFSGFGLRSFVNVEGDVVDRGGAK